MIVNVGRLMGSPKIIVSPPPSPPLTNLLLWLNAGVGVFQDTARTIPATATNDPVKGWTDQAGNGYNATSAQTPKLKLGGLNGQPTIVCNKDFFNFPGAALSNNNATFLVIKTGVTADAFTIGFSDILNSGNFCGLPDATSSGGNLFYLNSTAQEVDQVVPNTTVFNLIETGADGVLLYAGVNGNLASASGSAVTIFASIGGWNFTNSVLIGEIAEALAYTPRPSNGDLQLIRSYLNGKYNLY